MSPAQDFFILLLLVCSCPTSAFLTPRLYRMGGGRIPSAKAGDMRLIGSKDGSFAYSTSSTRWVGGPSPYAFGQREKKIIRSFLSPFYPESKPCTFLAFVTSLVIQVLVSLNPLLSFGQSTLLFHIPTATKTWTKLCL